MNREKFIELATYIGVSLLIWVVSPLLGRWIDSFYFLHHSQFSNSILILLPGVFLATAGTLLVIWTIFLFKTRGHGTPNPKLPPKEFIISGPYRFSRNPMALGGLLTLVGEAAIYGSPSLLILSALFGVIIYFNAMWVEEPELKERFGSAYMDYLRKVPRFFPNPWKWYR